MSLGSVTFYFGQESFLIDEAVDTLISNLPNATLQPMDSKVTYQGLVQASLSTGLFCSEQILLIKNPSFLTQTLTKPELAQWHTFFSEFSSSSTSLVIAHHGALDQRKAMVSRLKKCAKTQHFEPFKDWEQDKLTQWINTRIRKKNKSIDDDALMAFQQICGMNLRQCASEIETLCVFLNEDSRIQLSHIKAFCSEEQSSVFQFLEALKKRQPRALFSTLKNLRHHGEDPVKLIGLLTASFRLYLQLLCHQKEGKSEAAIAKLVGRHPFFVKQVLRDIRGSYSISDISTIIQSLATFDMAIKSGSMNAKRLFGQLPLLLAR